ncbi:MAG: hypothetical protein P8177_04420, partial [Gemmatimonadota bacterium]
SGRCWCAPGPDARPRSPPAGAGTPLDGTGEVRAEPQPGGFYGGWVTPDLAGPIKGGPGSSGW